MNAIKFLALFMLLSCQSRKDIGKVKLPFGTCQFGEIELKFEPVKDLPSSLRNQKLASLYVYQLQKEKELMITCYTSVIDEVNK